MVEKLVLMVCLHLFLSPLSRGVEAAVNWAVKIAGEAYPEARAREIAAERGLEFVGRVEPFPDVFELRLSREVTRARSVDNTGRVPSVDDVHNELSAHPDVKWASKQVALKRVKRDFSDPAFSQQWHLVPLTLCKIYTRFNNLFSSG